MLLREHLQLWFRARGFQIETDGTAVAASGYGEGGIVVDLVELEKELAEAVTRRVGVELGHLRREKVLTQADEDQVYERLRSVFVSPDWMPAHLKSDQ